MSMTCSKHILNAQVAVRAPCCQRFFDCPECHAEQAPDHPLRKTTEMAFICKKCKRAFRKDLAEFEQGADEYCPHCDNLYVLPAKTPSSSSSQQLPSSNPDVPPIDARQDSSLFETLDPRLPFDQRRDIHSQASRETEAGERIDIGGLRGVVEGSMARRNGGEEDLSKMDDELDWS